MRLRVPELNIHENDLVSSDKLNRLENAEYIAKILYNSPQPLVISIDGTYGSGKTFFLGLLKQVLEKHNFPTIYFSAWESDFYGNAMVALLGELNERIEARSNGDKPKELLSEVKDKLNKSATKIISTTASKMARIALTKVTGLSKEEFDEIKKTILDLDDSIINDQIEEYEAIKENINNFRDNLSKIAENLTEVKREDTEDKKDKEGSSRELPLVIFIDELDRCKPTYAVELLEVIKHFFNVPNVMFIIGVNKAQLKASLRTLYGSDLDADGYLRRFIDLDYILPNTNLDDFIDSLFDKFDLKDIFKRRLENPQNEYDESDLKLIFKAMFSSMNLSLRTQEKCMSQVSVALLITRAEMPIFPLLFSTLLCIKVKESEFYEMFIQKPSFPELYKFINQYLPTIDPEIRDFIKLQFELSVMSNHNGNLYIRRFNSSAQGKRKHNPIYSLEANRILDIIQKRSVDLRIFCDCLPEIINKIEISTHFEG